MFTVVDGGLVVVAVAGCAVVGCAVVCCSFAGCDVVGISVGVVVVRCAVFNSSVVCCSVVGCALVDSRLVAVYLSVVVGVTSGVVNVVGGEVVVVLSRFNVDVWCLIKLSFWQHKFVWFPKFYNQ